MKFRPASVIDIAGIETPAFVIEENILRHNLSILRFVREQTGCKMYQALKTWATFPLFHITQEYLDGTEVSSLNEARLGHDEFGKDVHMFAPAYKTGEMSAILENCSTIIFNSFAQWTKFKPIVDEFVARTGKNIECGLRINPEYLGKDEHGGLWSPCAPGSRLGIRVSEFEQALNDNPNALDGISGFHFHIFWDKNFEDLQQALYIVEQKFGKYFPCLQWVNFGGGQMITNDGYDVQGLIALINEFQKKHNVIAHMEPGAAIVRDAGVLIASVLDIVYRDDVPYQIVILDISFNAHTPDFMLSSDLNMMIRGAKTVRDIGKLSRKQNIYQLAGGTCVTGDKLGHFHVFDKPLSVGDKVIIEDGIQYNMVQCTMFNGVQHPSIVFSKENGDRQIIREFTYQDYRSRMG